MLDGLTITKINLTTGASCAILRTAIEAGQHGIGYWAAIEEWSQHPKNGRVERVVLIDKLDDRQRAKARYLLTPSYIERALLRMLQYPEKTRCRGILPQVFGAGLDGPLADAIVQVACFGEVKYS